MVRMVPNSQANVFGIIEILKVRKIVAKSDCDNEQRYEDDSSFLRLPDPIFPFRKPSLVRYPILPSETL
jgi:hypothetical protein